MQAEISFKIITILGIIRSLKKNKYSFIGPAAFKSQRYRVGYQSNQKYYITIRIQKISSIHKFNLQIQQILRSHELKGHVYPKIIEATFSFPEFVASCKKSAYSNSSFLGYIQF